MHSVKTFYLSWIIGRNVYSSSSQTLGRLVDIVVDSSFVRPKIIAIKVKQKKNIYIYDYSDVVLVNKYNKIVIILRNPKEIDISGKQILYLAKNILDKQVVDVNGRKVVRVNDLRLAEVSTGTYLIAVDVGLEGLLRRLGINDAASRLLKPFNHVVSNKLMLWDDVETIDFSNVGIRISKSRSKLDTLHPSDLADIIEDLDRKSQAAIFAALDEEKAADVLEELEVDAQRNVIDSMTLEKAADVLEKMPADEVADLLDDLEVDKAEELLGEMEIEASVEVRELMEYPEKLVGSIMSTDYMSFSPDTKIIDVLNELRDSKPESNIIYNIYVIDNSEKLLGTVSIRDLIVNSTDTTLEKIMLKEPHYISDTAKISKIPEIISKYNLLAIPVVNKEMIMIGTVIIDDILDKLIDK